MKMTPEIALGIVLAQPDYRFFSVDVECDEDGDFTVEGWLNSHKPRLATNLDDSDCKYHAWQNGKLVEIADEILVVHQDFNRCVDLYKVIAERPDLARAIGLSEAILDSDESLSAVKLEEAYANVQTAWHSLYT